MIEGRFLYGADDDLSDVFQIRRKVFVEEKGISEDNEFDGFDNMCLHGLIKVQGKMLGAGRIFYDGETFRLGHIAVLADERGKKYGDFLVRMLIDRCFVSGALEVVAETGYDTAGFFEKIGFYKSGGVNAGTDDNKQIILKLTKDSLCKECGNMEKDR